MDKNPVWVLGETYGGAVLPVTYEVMSRAAVLAEKLGAPLEVFIISGPIMCG